MNKVICASGIFYPISIFTSFIDANEICLEQNENYQKRSYRNRYSILTSNGILNLSIPLKKGKNENMPIKDVRISYDENWSEKHIQTIRSAYGKSPYFEYYFYIISAILKQRMEFLFDLNHHALLQILNLLNWKIEVQFTENFERNYYNYTDLRNFHSLTNVDIHSEFSPYVQVWSDKFPFYSNLSILDVLFCTGPESSFVLRKLQSINQKNLLL
ncbi:MAG: WbqC family protein [Saprospiraceae bacterium]|nr:WbqC family protein [Saprospiraceae bacterium]